MVLTNSQLALAASLIFLSTFSFQNIQISLKSTNGPIDVFLCPDEADNSPVKSDSGSSTSDYASISEAEDICQGTTVISDQIQEEPISHMNERLLSSQETEIAEFLECSSVSQDLIPLSPITDHSSDYFYSLTEEEGLMDLYDMYDLPPSFSLDD